MTSWKKETVGKGRGGSILDLSTYLKWQNEIKIENLRKGNFKIQFTRTRSYRVRIWNIWINSMCDFPTPFQHNSLELYLSCSTNHIIQGNIKGIRKKLISSYSRYLIMVMYILVIFFLISIRSFSFNPCICNTTHIKKNYKNRFSTYFWGNT